MNNEQGVRKLGKKTEQETLEISSTGYGLESVESSQETDSTTTAQKGNDSESSWAGL
ncbi:hypothetical protein [Bacillus benzoevorans]|uniref:Uncharacterized protein n=1 Tax=Bacillus benzoevorans TaxID=1456 RepID=A0A7X0HSQ2_9BACI|nr:hypothetical protein [Bacillus benzoevorans]MBB6446160.1 hypothetical protein [Bacillus benzoevorans]